VPSPSPTETKLQIDRPELVIQTEHTKPIRVVTVSLNGRWLASGSEDNTIKLWDATTGNLLRTLSGHTHTVLALAISPDGLLVASGSEDRTVKLWEVTSGRELHSRGGDGHASRPSSQ